MIYKVTINDKVYEVEVEKGKANLLRTTAVEAVPAPVAAAPAAAAPKAAPAAAAPAAGAHTVDAPLPGTIKQVCVAVGQEIAAGDTVVVMEAMKMENNITAEFAGTVKAILVEAGAQVQSGQALVELD